MRRLLEIRRLGVILSQQEKPEIAMRLRGLGFVGAVSKREFVFTTGGVGMVLLLLQHTQVVMRRRKLGDVLGGRFEVRLGQGGPSHLHERGAKIVLGNAVAAGYGKRVREEGIAVVPVVDL